MQTGQDTDAVIRGALRLLREHLGLDVAFISQLTDDLRVLRYLDADDRSIIDVGDSDPAEESYCHHVVAGTVPQFLSNAARHPVTSRMAATAALPVGTHLSVPLVFSDGSVYGTFCGLTYSPAEHLGERDLEVLRLLAGMVAGLVEQAELDQRARTHRRARLLALDPGDDVVVVLQPIIELSTEATVGFEALARFPTLGAGPAAVFDEAWRLGVGVELELAALGVAFEVLEGLADDVSLAVNVAPDTLTDERFLAAVRASSPRRLVIEITEHARVTDYADLRRAIGELKAVGGRLAVDDVGTGFSGLDHILRLEPDILKIDGAIVRDLDHLSGKQAMVAALVAFARAVGAIVVAEQVETAEEVRALTELGVNHAQGYHFGRPAPPAELRAVQRLAAG